MLNALFVVCRSLNLNLLQGVSGTLARPSFPYSISPSPIILRASRTRVLRMEPMLYLAGLSSGFFQPGSGGGCFVLN